VDAAVIVAVHQREALALLRFRLGTRHLAVAIDVEFGDQPVAHPLHALAQHGVDLVLGDDAVAVGVEALEAAVVAGEILAEVDGAVAIGVEPAKTTLTARAAPRLAPLLAIPATPPVAVTAVAGLAAAPVALAIG